MIRPNERELLNTALAGRYTIERELGRGGMATVYLANDVKHRRPVAIKVLRPELAAAMGPDRFLREVEIAASLNHPHILALYDSGEADGLLFYVMPYVAGESLRNRLDREHQLPLADALAIIRQVAAALEHAHARKVIHRDIKPENILLYEGEAMVADFGIALAVSAAAEDRLTETGIAVGTPEYMSPEQAVGQRELDARSDVYSLACVLYELLAGEPPFTGRTAQAILAKRFADPVPPVGRLRAGIPAGVEQALRTALARAPADRFASAAAFVEALTKPAGAPPKSRSIAVLPFVNLSADAANEYFADGITEDVIAQLSKVGALQVTSRTSVMPFKNREQGLRQIAATLQVGTLLEGSVRRAGDRVRIVAQLIDAETDKHLWTDTYDRQLTDIFEIQADVALHIAAALKAELSADERTRIRKEPTSDMQAYQLYLKGRHFFIRFTPEGMRKSIECFEQATARDPGYALAHAGIAKACLELGESGALAPDEAYARAKVAVATALKLDGDLGEARSTSGYLQFVADFRWADAEAEFLRALELNPSNADAYDYYGRLLSSLERHDEAISMLQRAQELDPVAHRVDLATELLRAGRYDDALRSARVAMDVDPQYARGHATLAWAYLKTGRNDEGLAELEQAVRLAPGNTSWLAQLGEAYGLTGKISQARTVLAQLQDLAQQRYVAPYHLAYVHTGLGEQDRAMDWLERAYEQRSGAVYGIKGSFLFTTLRSHPRFIALLRKMNLA
ncbi:MAG TPA: protein kinase [Gemmatimonadales bacterium]|nr:protein kinase [Gemmatimonadales bacterium]